METEKQVVEINGIKMEVDMRKVKSGVVVGFEPFDSLPTIIVCYLDADYNSSKISFAYINTDTREKFEIVASIDDDLPVRKQDVLSKMDREIEKKREEIADIERKRQYFLDHFNCYFEGEVLAIPHFFHP